MQVSQNAFQTRSSHDLPEGDANISGIASTKDEAETPSKRPVHGVKSPKSTLLAAGARPLLLRAAPSTATPTSASSTPNATTPLLSRPVLHRSEASADAVRALKTTNILTRPPLLRRATDLVTSPLAANAPGDGAGRDKPKMPTFWADHLHRKPLLQLWDEIEQSRKQASLAAHLDQAHMEMSRRYAELAAGETTLTTEWIELVLGDCLRHPFSTAVTTGTWQRFAVRLAVAAGSRGNWGPW